MEHSRHSFELLTQSGRHWKWRLGTSGIELSSKLPRDKRFDLVMVSDFVDLATLKGLSPSFFHNTPVLALFHENQFSYPLSHGESRDYSYAIKNIATIMAADTVWFNSAWNLTSFWDGFQEFIRRAPTKKNLWDINRSKLEVMHLGFTPSPYQRKPHSGVKTILWNHRWEYDKNPQLFIDTLLSLQEKKIPFQLILLGEQPRGHTPELFSKAKELFAKETLFAGYLSSRDEYYKKISEADIIVSTAGHEFFGYSILEAISAGLHPILPNALSYPELFSHGIDQSVFYRSPKEFETLLSQAVSGPLPLCQEISNGIQGLVWKNRVKQFDEGFNRIKKLHA